MRTNNEIRGLVEHAPLLMQQWRGEIIPFLEWWDGRTPLLDRRVVEIGTGSGGLTTVWAQLAALVISVDVPPTVATQAAVTKRDRLISEIAESCGNRYTAIFGRSQEAETVGAVILTLAEQPADLLFLDGDHSLEGLRRDWVLYRPLVRSGGVVVFHDLNSLAWPSVAQVWDEVHCPGIDSKVFTVNGTWGGLGGIIV